MDTLIKALGLLFGENPELRQIIGVTLHMSFISTGISSLLGIPLGVLIGSNDFKGKHWVQRVSNTLMGLPPVVAGLAVFLLLSRSGPLGTLKLLYSVSAMVIAQVVLITPIMTGLTTTITSLYAPRIKETAQGVGIPHWRQMGLIIYECRSQLVSTMMVGFGRAIAEVGAVQIVGGNVQYRTRVMTTAIMMQTNMGQFQFAIALGIVLLIISFGINALVNHLESWEHFDRTT